MTKDEIERLLCTMIDEWFSPGQRPDPEVFKVFIRHSLSPRLFTDLAFTLLGETKKRNLPREQWDAIVAHLRQRTHEAVDLAYDDCISRFEQKPTGAALSDDGAM